MEGYEQTHVPCFGHLTSGEGKPGEAEPVWGERVTRRSLLQGGATVALGMGLYGASARSAEAAQDGTSSWHALPKQQAKVFVIEPSWTLAWENDEFKLLRDHSIVVEDGVIAEITDQPKRGRYWRIQGDGDLLLPGFISGHSHTQIVSATRALVGRPGAPGPSPILLADSLSDEERDDLMAYRLAETLRSGCTTRFEQALSLTEAQSYVRVSKRFAARGYVSGMTPNWTRLFPIWLRTNDQVLFDSEAETLAEIEANRAFALANNNTEEGRILMQMGPHALNTHTLRAIRRIAEVARELGNGIHTHLSQDEREVNDILRLFGRRPVQFAEDVGWYSAGPFIGAHLRGIDLVVDLPALVRNNVHYGYCPHEGGVTGTTLPRFFPEALAAGLNTSIGIEFSNDYLQTMVLSVPYGGSRFALLSPTSPVPLKNPSIWDALRAGTVNGAKIVGREDIGRIAVGAKADLTVVDVSHWLVGAFAPPPQPVYNLLYANGLSVKHTMTDGILQVFDGHLVIDDERRVVERGAAVQQKIWEQATANDWFDFDPH
jgi:5-methylthioadenosine/S-adenosylhomocysteine deaminase